MTILALLSVQSLVGLYGSPMKIKITPKLDRNEYLIGIDETGTCTVTIKSQESFMRVNEVELNLPWTNTNPKWEGEQELSKDEEMTVRISFDIPDEEGEYTAHVTVTADVYLGGGEWGESDREHSDLFIIKVRNPNILERILHWLGLR